MQFLSIYGFVAIMLICIHNLTLFFTTLIIHQIMTSMTVYSTLNHFVKDEKIHQQIAL